MTFWIRLDRELAGARSDNGFIHPDAVESALDRWGIRRPENRDVSKRMLDALAAGRSEAMAMKIEPEKQATRRPNPKR